MSDQHTYLLTAHALDPATVTAVDVETAAAEYLTAALRSGALNSTKTHLSGPLAVTVVHADKSRSTIWMRLDFEPVFFEVAAPKMLGGASDQMRARA